MAFNSTGETASFCRGATPKASENEFFLKVVEAKITFVKDGTGKVTGVIHEQGGRRFEAPKIE